MLGTLLTAGVGALAFKLGMDAQQMSSEGMSAGEIIASMPKALYDTVANTASYVSDVVTSSVGCCFCSDDDDDEDTEAKPKPKSKAKPKAKANKAKPSAKSKEKAAKPAPKAKPAKPAKPEGAAPKTESK